ncbi:hypothetical protein, partial [Nitratireductor sp. GCM10026969]|uniref:hypothetical protein n=1 Tax=Nitratireductor sp. GCM10026969 TaxID=3252645 RepID=UPI00361863B7
LAGLPAAVVERAREVLHRLEESETGGQAARIVDDLPLFTAAVRQEPVKRQTDSRLVETLAGFNPDEMTPREALDALYRLKALDSGD